MMRSRDDEEALDDGWSGTRVRLHRIAHEGAVRVVDDALPAALAHEAYEYTVGLQRSWGAYVPLSEAAEGSADGPRAPARHAAAARVAAVRGGGSGGGCEAREMR